MNDYYKTAYDMVKVLIQGEIQDGQALPADLIPNKVDTILAMLGSQGMAAGVDRERLIRELEGLYTIWIGEGSILEDQQDHEQWLPQRRAEIEWNFWKRYRDYLELNKGWPTFVVNRLEQVTDSILERLEDPERLGAWDRRGMVVGQVQSGKTSNYTGLVCKAVDSGYKLIVVLAGVHKSLRSQTQLRLDEGFLGFNSQVHKATDAANSRIGAGTIPVGKFLIANSGTNSEDNGDFSKKVARQYGVVPGSDPVLMVVKKNKTVLKNLVDWAVSIRGVEDSNTGRKVVKDVPLLIIDDEADNASVNTREVVTDEDGKPLDEQDCTAINGLIRKLLYSFEKSAYVGYTATPFANIFIHEDVDTATHGPDLFPQHFIINIPTPSNYIGPVKVFGLSDDSVADLDETEGLNIIRTVDDQEDWMPPKHKKNHIPEFLPSSLEEAINSFFLTCSVRIWRGQSTEHNSMLVHVTRFTDVQACAAQLIRDYLTEAQRRLRYGESNISNRLIDRLEYLWRYDYEPTSQEITQADTHHPVSIPTWEDIKPLLYQAVGKIQVKQINGTAKDILDYQENPGGLNVIAIGGDKLSRGLTLEGLSVSYYLRASRMYDTLMQMGRWFGYRPGYLDLCRLYTTDDLVEWYRHITLASEELRKEFDYMVAAGDTPRNFGLKVRTHPSGLLVTGATKMKSGTKMQLSFAGSISETYLFHKNDAINSHNLQVTENLVQELGTYKPPEEYKGNYVWTDVDNGTITAFLEGYKSHPNARLANTRSLLDYIRTQIRRGELTSWSIALISSNKSQKNSYTLANLNVGLIVRKDASEDSSTEYRLVKSRLLSPVDEMIDFPKSVQEEILEETAQRRQKAGKPPAKSRTPDGKIVRSKRHPTNGLLLFYPLDPESIKSNIPVIGFCISFPGSIYAQPVEYKVNNIYWNQEMLGDDD